MPKEYAMQLTGEEKAILEGKQGETLRKALESVEFYGQIFGAQKLAPIEGSVHLVTSFGIPLLKPVFAIMDELINAKLKTGRPFIRRGGGVPRRLQHPGVISEGRDGQ